MRFVFFLVFVMLIPWAARGECSSHGAADPVGAVIEVLPPAPQIQEVGGFAAFLSGVSEALGNLERLVTEYFQYSRFEPPSLEQIKKTGELIVQAHVEAPGPNLAEVGNNAILVAEYGRKIGADFDLSHVAEGGARLGDAVGTLGDIPGNVARFAEGTDETMRNLGATATFGIRASIDHITNDTGTTVRLVGDYLKYAHGPMPYADGSAQFSAGREAVSKAATSNH